MFRGLPGHCLQLVSERRPSDRSMWHRKQRKPAVCYYCENLRFSVFALCCRSDHFVLTCVYLQVINENIRRPYVYCRDPDVFKAFVVTGVPSQVLVDPSLHTNRFS